MMPTNNHPNRNAAQSKIRAQYTQLEFLADILEVSESSNVIRRAIADLKSLRSEVSKLKTTIDSINKSQQS